MIFEISKFVEMLSLDFILENMKISFGMLSFDFFFENTLLLTPLRKSSESSIVDNTLLCMTKIIK